MALNHGAHRLRWVVLLSLTLLLPHPAQAAPARQPIPVPEEGALVYDENGNGQADLFGDTWVYDTNSDGRAELILRFRQEPALVAYLYDDANANGQVDYLVTGAGVQILEAYWRVKLTAREGKWLLPGNVPDWNAEMVVDGNYRFSGTNADFLLTGYRDNHQDGQPDLLLAYWDVNHDGIPDYERNTLAIPPYEEVIANRNPRLRPHSRYRFPWLGTVLQPDWARARLALVMHLIPSHTNEQGYYVSFGRPLQGQLLLPGWENPFAFYDLAGDADGFSELSVRLVSEYEVWRHPSLTAYNEVRYSWAQDENHMRYRLYLIGQVFRNDSVPYPSYAISHVPYEQIPAFVCSSQWTGAIFGEYEASQRKLSFDEGIYENLLFTVALRGRLLSQRAVELPPYLPAYLNLREEYNFHLNRTPTLYFSPIDRRLHLRDAQQGLLILDAHLDPNNHNGFDFTDQELATGQAQVLRYLTESDSDGDGYFDTWTLYFYNQPVEKLVFRRGTVLFARGNTVYLKRLPADLHAALWETSPPTDTLSWRALNERLATDAAERPPLDSLAALFAALPGESTALSNTSLGAVSTNAGELIASLTTAGLESVARPQAFAFFAQNIPAGEYLLRGKDGAYWLEAPAPAAISLSPITFIPASGSSPGGWLLFYAINGGAQDAQARLQLTETLTGGGFAIIHEEEALVPAYGQREFIVPWVPAIGGERRLRARLTYTSPLLSAPAQTEAEATLTVPAPPAPAATLYLAFPDLLAPLLLATALLALLVPGLQALLSEEARP